MVFGKLFLLLLSACVVLGHLDYYEVLGVGQDATAQQIKRAFRKMSMKWHPDKNPGDDAAAQKFLELNEAHDVLSDEEKRQVYDMDGHEGLEQLKKGGGGSRSPFDMFFGGGGGGRRKGPDYRMDLEVTLEDLYNGLERKLQVNRNVICKGCRGTGAKDGDTKTCPSCGGQGTKMTLQRLGPGFNVQMQTTCDVCSGKGKIAKSQCPICAGKRVVPEKKTLEVYIERGMPDGHELVFERASEQSPETTPGDVILRLKTRKHSTFTRKGNDLHMTMRISLKDALLGFSRTINHLDGRKVEISRDIVTPPSFVMKVEGEGMPHHQFPSDKGHLFVKFKVQFPKTLTEGQKAAIENLL